MKIKLIASYNPEQEEMKEYFINSIKDDWDFNIVKYGVAADLTTGAYYDTVRKKYETIINEIKNNFGKIVILADIDIQFFRKCNDIIINLMKDLDLAILPEKLPWKIGDDVNGGFVVIKCNDKTLSLFQEIYSTRNTWTGYKGDQFYLSELLKKKHIGNNFKYDKLPIQFWMRRYTDKIPPKDIIMHHAVQDDHEPGGYEKETRVKLKMSQLKEIKREVDFFEEEYFFDRFWGGTCWDYHKQAYWNLINPETRRREFPNLLMHFITPSESPIKLLEIGCGGCSNLAWGVDRKLFEITAIDPMGDRYAEQLKKHKINYPIIPIKMAAEDIHGHFKEGTFDIVYARNSLDHTANPRKCIKNVYNVLKNGGIFFIEGFVKEGTYTGWSGLHQFDFVVEGDDLISYTKKGERVNLTENLGFKKLFQSSESSIKEPPKEEKFTVVFEK